MVNRKTKTGFTLSELLIVVAIIAVLVAIAIPVFKDQIEKSREASDIANIRSGYAEVMTAGMMGDDTVPSASEYTVELTQIKNGWQTEGIDEALHSLGKVNGEPQTLGSCTIYYDKNGNQCIFEFTGSRPVSVSGNYTNKVTQKANDFYGLVNYFLVKKNINDADLNRLLTRAKRLDSLRDDQKGVELYYYQTGDENLWTLLKGPMKEKGYTDSDIDAMKDRGSLTGIYLDKNGNLVAYTGTIDKSGNYLHFSDGTSTKDKGNAATDPAVADYLISHGGSLS